MVTSCIHHERASFAAAAAAAAHLREGGLAAGVRLLARGILLAAGAPQRRKNGGAVRIKDGSSRCILKQLQEGGVGAWRCY